MIFPVFCLGCGCEGAWVCDRCVQTIDTSGILLCPICHEVQPYGMCCSECQPYSYIDNHIAAVAYTHGSLPAQMIEALKYSYVTDLVGHIVQLMVPVLEDRVAMFEAVDMVVPIPLHAKRFAERGFNQAALIALYIGQYVSCPVEQLLIRETYTQQQARLEKEERERNTEGVFVKRSGVEIEGKTILLFDDVFTTGSTMQSAAKTLRENGASSVVGLSVARG